MNWDAWIPLLVVASSLLPGLIIFGLAEDRVRTAHRCSTWLGPWSNSHW